MQPLHRYMDVAYWSSAGATAEEQMAVLRSRHTTLLVWSGVLNWFYVFGVFFGNAASCSSTTAPALSTTVRPVPMRSRHTTLPWV